MVRTLVKFDQSGCGLLWSGPGPMLQSLHHGVQEVIQEPGHLSDAKGSLCVPACH